MATKQWVKAAMPSGVATTWGNYRAMQRLGIPIKRQAVLGFDEIHSSRLDLLPRGALTPGGVFVDVGAHVGDWTAAALLLSPHSVLAVEANPVLVDHLAARFVDRRVTVRGAAAGPDRGAIRLNVTKAPWMSSVLIPRLADEDQQYGIIRSVEVDMLPLDDMTADLPQISVLKVDVQGFEREVIKGATATLERSQFVLLEVNFRSHYKGDALFYELAGLMENRGFVLAGLSQAHVVDGWAMWSDAVFRRR